MESGGEHRSRDVHSEEETAAARSIIDYYGRARIPLAAAELHGELPAIGVFVITLARRSPRHRAVIYHGDLNL